MTELAKQVRSLSARGGAGRFFAGAVRAFSYCPFSFVFLFPEEKDRKRMCRVQPA